MDLKGHMNVLLKEKERVESLIEADVRYYAELSNDASNKLAVRVEQEQKLKILRTFFENFTTEEKFSKDSVHFRNCERERETVNRERAVQK